MFKKGGRGARKFSTQKRKKKKRLARSSAGEAKKMLRGTTAAPSEIGIRCIGGGGGGAGKDEVPAKRLG